MSAIVVLRNKEIYNLGFTSLKYWDGILKSHRKIFPLKNLHLEGAFKLGLEDTVFEERLWFNMWWTSTAARKVLE